MHDNSYRPPSASLDTNPTGESEQGAFARRTAIVLAVAGNLPCMRIQCDEIWSFVGAKQKQVNAGAQGVGDVWT
jgi:hypothetical protein